MHKSRNSLLIMLVLVTVSLMVHVASAMALDRYSVDPLPPGTTRPGDTWSAGEPDGSGSGTPLPGQSPPLPGRYSSGQVRGEAPVATPKSATEWMRWMSRIWTARILGVTR